MAEQRTPYKGSPPRPWVRVALVSADGTTNDVEVLADNGNPCALIVSTELLRQFNLGLVPGMQTNFGPLEGGWLRVQIAEIGLDEELLAYGSNAVAQAAAASHADFQGLAGLPLLRMMEYGGDDSSFWVRRP